MSRVRVFCPFVFFLSLSPLWYHLMPPCTSSTSAAILILQSRRDQDQESEGACRPDCCVMDSPVLTNQTSLCPCSADLHPSQDDDDFFSPTSFHHQLREQQGMMDSRPRVPLIVLAQQRQQMQMQLQNHEPESSAPSPLPATWRALSTITELTERTEVPSNFQANRHLLDQRTIRPPSSASTITSYGKVLCE